MLYYNNKKSTLVFVKFDNIKESKMSYSAEMQLIRSTLGRIRVPIVTFCRDDNTESLVDNTLLSLFGEDIRITAKESFDKIKPMTVYRLKTPFCFNYIMLSLPNKAKSTILAIGPYLSAPVDEIPIFEIGEKYSIPPSEHKLLFAYYQNVAYLPESSHIFIILDAFAERLWGSGNYSVVDIDEKFLGDAHSISSVPRGTPDDVVLNMKIMEERYKAENELMRAISHGQVHEGARLMASFESMPFEKRLDDPLRNLKNYSIIMNTLFRKAAETGGIHPIYLNEMSSDFAKKIEKIGSVSELRKLMGEMYRSYCLMVRKYTTKNYSPIVHKAKLMIEADLSQDLSLSSLAAAQKINPSYLSTLFKKETGKTVTDYIFTERMKLAEKLLETTNLQIQTVALHCGILDVQYFSKLFKKHTGMPPKEYRQRSKNITRS